MTRKRMIHAINDALAEEMERDERVILIGEDVGASIFGDTRGLLDRFGPARVRDTPISEALLGGMAVGAAAAGYRVVCHLMYANFVYTAFDAIANQAARLRLMTNGQIRLPVTFIASGGGGRSNAGQHSDYPHTTVAGLGGIYVATPATASDAKGLLKTAIRTDDPVFFLQPTSRGGEMGEVPDGDHTVPLGKARIVREGGSVTIVAIGAMLRAANKAAEALSEEGIDVEIVDPRTCFPLDENLILDSVRKTGRLVVVDEARRAGSMAGPIAALVAEKVFDSLKAPIVPVTTRDLAIAYAPPLEQAMIPGPTDIIEAVRRISKESVT
ncbi:alpha-ketoacid dehydrogenase subunit beta [Nitratireductor sp. CAU 1489]|uniref:Alpha-ketoacid dehydrogenase subunit beta n=1 Tax=Nitratireductor arenosus TaxID=2682096 RepID=A0A844QAP9_9HYPH|nr:transketolase C-terminal domain-containing protein [Nitratireductor arenosus]MVA96007.1 alpha-ketoacid dehydrogenase subunit beta [Nitratireductor arenosus]